MNIYKRIIAVFFSTAIIIVLGFAFHTPQQHATIVNPGGPGSGSGGNPPPSDECANASCGAGTYCGGDCGVTGSHDNLYSCAGNCTSPGSGCHKSTVTYCGPNKCQPQIVGGDICAGGSSSTGAPNACQNNGGNCLTANSNGACPNNGATLPYTCSTSGTICCSQGGDKGSGGNGGGNVSAGVQCGSTSGSCANQSCNSNSPGYCEDNTNTCVGTTKQIKVYTCQNGIWTFAYNQTGGSKCYTSACIAPGSGSSSGGSGVTPPPTITISCEHNGSTANTENGYGYIDSSGKFQLLAHCGNGEVCKNINGGPECITSRCQTPANAFYNDNTPYYCTGDPLNHANTCGSDILICGLQKLCCPGNPIIHKISFNSSTQLISITAINSDQTTIAQSEMSLSGDINVSPNNVQGQLSHPSYLASTNQNTNSPVLSAQTYKLPLVLTYDTTQKLFVGSNLDTSAIPVGTYNMYLHVDKFLDAQFIQKNGLNTFTFTGSAGTIDSRTVTMVPGDIAPSPHGDNVIDIQDYNTMITCLQNPNQGNCLGLADLNLDGKVDNQDLQILLSHFGSLGASPTIPGFTCVNDPSCKQDSSKSIQLCPLKCTKTAVNQ